MSSFSWKQEEEHLVQLLMPTRSCQEISEELARRHFARVAGFPCLRSEDAVRRKISREKWTAETALSYQTDNPISDTWTRIREIQNRYRKGSVLRRRGVLEEHDTKTKILSLSDIHLPLTRDDLLREVVDKESDTDVVVVNGDLMEGYIFSRFAKSKRIAALDEYHAAFELIFELSRRFPSVVLVAGNHDVRASKMLGRVGLETEASQVLRPDLLARLANGEKLDATGMLVERVPMDNVFYDPRESWYAKIGKTLFIHPHGMGSAKPGHTVSRWGERLLHRYDDDEVDSIVCGHTHQIYKGVINSRLYIEQGCMADMLSYHHAPGSPSKFNYMNGYAVIYQDSDGNTNFNMSGPVYLGECLPPKKEMSIR